MSVENMKQQCKDELVNRIIPFWKNLADFDNGGFYGYVDNNLAINKEFNKGVILNSRILWFFSNCSLILKDKECLKYAEHAFKFLEKCIDKEYGGVYWHMDYKGNPADEMKHTYNIAFAIYALSSYYMASKNQQAILYAYELFDTIESKTIDEIGYVECFDRTWNVIDNKILSENGLLAEKTMNTVLHLIEAYTELYKADSSGKVKERLEFLLNQYTDKIFDAENNKLFVFFDKNLNVIGDIHSYGHDIEASWLTDLACETLGNESLTLKCKEINLKISNNIFELAFKNGALNNERENDKIDTKRVWWVQAEGVVGFYNAYQKSGESKYIEISEKIWDYIKNNFSDKRQGGEWHAYISQDGDVLSFPVVDPWKCPYHNGRMCLEVIKR